VDAPIPVQRDFLQDSCGSSIDHFTRTPAAKADTVGGVTARALPKWHVRRQRPDARTTVVYFIDVDANRMTFAQFFDELESNEDFRALFSAELAASTEKPFTWETPSLTKTTIVREF
jgi:hypothetical protein